jgi:transposase-like protein
MSSRKINSTSIFNQTEEELKTFLESSFTESLRQLIRVTVKTMIKAEMEEFRKEMKDLIGSIYFNGSYDRQLVGPFGTVENIPVPRFRDNPANFTPQTLAVFDEQKDKFLKVMAEMHRLGISQRKIKQLAESCFNTKLSTTKVGAVYKELADQESAVVNTCSLQDEYNYLLADGLWIKAKGYGWEEDRAVILCILGIKASGERKIIGFTVERAENYECWHNLLLSIKQRGLAGSNLKLIISDDGKGFEGAIKQLFPSIPHQICITHKMRDVIGKTKHKNKIALAKDVKLVYQQSSKKEALIKAKQFVQKWYLVEPKAINSFKYHFETTLTYYNFDRSSWHQIRTTNILEREFRELRRRIKVMDSSFNNTDSAGRYAGSLINYLNQNYPSQRRTLHTRS